MMITSARILRLHRSIKNLLDTNQQNTTQKREMDYFHIGFDTEPPMVQDNLLTCMPTRPKIRTRISIGCKNRVDSRFRVNDFVVAWNQTLYKKIIIYNTHFKATFQVKDYEQVSKIYPQRRTAF